MFKRIQKLPPELANQIAAGEVVERPASVLKEVLENSLDAGSTQIDITIERGGIGLISVEDNGVGICKEDLTLALSQHATSKIQTLSDLEGVLSFGFRGEALASIGAVSKLTLSSCTSDESMGWAIEKTGRNEEPVLRPIPKRQGTAVSVKDLFYNTPARRKFLRSEKTEQNYLEEIFKRIALSKPEVGFRLFQGERLQKRLLPCKDLTAHKRRVAELCGNKFAEEAYFVEAEANGFKLIGWLGSEKALRSQPDLQYFYVNGRIVRDKVVSHAIKTAYQEICLPGRYPAYVLYFELDPLAVDVNVHPTKHEVRFRETRSVHAFLSYSIQEGLKQVNQITMPAMFGKEELFSSEPLFESLRDIKRTYVSPTSALKPLTLLGGELLLAENEAGLTIVDVKATRQYLMQQSLESLLKKQGVLPRPLLMPHSVTLSQAIESGFLETLNLPQLGFDINQIGPNTLLVRAVPGLFDETIQELDKLIQKILQTKTIEERVQILSNHIAETTPFSLFDAEKLLMDLPKVEFASDKGATRGYRQVTLAQLRSILLYS